MPEPPPLLPPRLETGVTVFAGDAVGGARGTVDAIEPGEGLIARCTLLWAERMPWEVARPPAPPGSSCTRAAPNRSDRPPISPRAAVSAREEALRSSRGMLPAACSPVEERGRRPGAGLTARFHARSPERLKASDGALVVRATSILVGRDPGAGARPSRSSSRMLRR